MNILIALIPAIGWGIQPMIISKMGGRETNQILGTGLGALLVGAITLIMTRMVTGAAFWLSLVSGAFWVIGQTGQYISFGRIGVSKTMPLSTGFQLVGTSLIGVLMFGEWQGSLARVLGFAAIALIIIGVLLTTVGEKSDGHTHSIWGPALTTLLPTSIGYWVYSALPKIPLLADKSGMSYFFPQMLGIFLGASVYALVVSKGKAFSEATTWKNGLVGIVFSISALAYIFFRQGQRCGHCIRDHTAERGYLHAGWHVHSARSTPRPGHDVHVAGAATGSRRECRDGVPVRPVS